MRLEGTDSSRRNARQLRRALIRPEGRLWLALRNNEARLRFRKQYAAGPYVLDFYCAPARLAIEVDGQAHESGDRAQRDAVRDRWLSGQGMRVVRYAARDVLTNLEGVVIQILSIATARRDTIEASRRPPLPSRASACHLPLAGED